MNKTLIGKEEYLFLQNDESKELEVHCNNLDLVKDKDLVRYKKYYNNIFFVNFPNKSLIYKKYLPNNYDFKYRPGFEIYKNFFGERLLDSYEFLKDEDDVYYKTDTHINLKGNYIIYKKFIEKINELYNLDIKIQDILIQVKSCILKNLSRGIGDLTWDSNLGEQKLDNIYDNYYYSNDILDFYMYYIIKNEKNIRFLDNRLIDNTLSLENQNTTWEIISKYIIYKKNEDLKYKVVIFYDSFLLSILPLYLNLFGEIYLVKNIYSNDLIDKIKPDYIFEFRVERFLF